MNLPVQKCLSEMRDKYGCTFRLYMWGKWCLRWPATLSAPPSRVHGNSWAGMCGSQIGWLDTCSHVPHSEKGARVSGALRCSAVKAPVIVVGCKVGCLHVTQDLLEGYCKKGCTFHFSWFTWNKHFNKYIAMSSQHSKNILHYVRDTWLELFALN